MNDDDTLNKDRNWPLTLDNMDNGQLIYKVARNNDEIIKITPTEALTMLLKDVKKVAQRYSSTSSSMVKAVITFPDHFSNEQRRELFTAAKKAEITILELISESEADILAFNINRHGEQIIVVAFLNFGGGSFNVSIIEVGRGRLKTLSTSMNDAISTRNFDELLMNHIIDLIQQKHGIKCSQIQEKKILKSCEYIKHQLSYVDKFE